MMILNKFKDGIWVQGKPDPLVEERRNQFLAKKEVLDAKFDKFLLKHAAVLDAYETLRKEIVSHESGWYRCQNCEQYITIDTQVNLWDFPSTSFPFASEEEANKAEREVRISSVCVWCCGYSIEELEQNQLEEKAAALGLEKME